MVSQKLLMAFYPPNKQTNTAAADMEQASSVALLRGAVARERGQKSSKSAPEFNWGHQQSSTVAVKKKIYIYTPEIAVQRKDMHSLNDLD